MMLNPVTGSPAAAPSAWWRSPGAHRRRVAPPYPVERCRSAHSCSNTARLRAVPMSPMCGDTTARSPQARQWCSSCGRPRPAPAAPARGSRSSSGAPSAPQPQRTRPPAMSGRPGHRRAARSAGRGAESPRRHAQAPLHGLAVGQHRLAADVGRGRHQRRPEIVQQHVVQRTVGQHHADLGQSRCDAAGTPRRPRRPARSAAGGAQQRPSATVSVPRRANSARPFRPGNITASGLCGRGLRARSRGRRRRSRHRTSGDSRRCP